MNSNNAKLIGGLVLGLSLSLLPSGAIPINITMVGDMRVVAAPARQLSDLGNSTVFSWLKADVAAFNASQGTSYPVPTANLDGSPLSKVDSFSGLSRFTATMASQDYAVLHWGGKRGGSVQAFYNPGQTVDYVFNAPPGGQPLVGGISFYSTYGSGSGGGGGSVPEGGVTIGLLGMALGGLVLVRKV